MQNQVSLWEETLDDPGVFPALMQSQFVTVVSKFQLLIEASCDPELRLGLADSLEHPELIDSPVTGPLDDVGPVFEGFPFHVEVQSVEVTLDHVYFPCSKDVPSLVIPIVRFIDDDTDSLL